MSASSLMTNLYLDIRDDQWPIVYCDRYNVSVGGLEKLHVFDAQKWRNIVEFLVNDHMIEEKNLVTPLEAKKEDLLRVHTPKYLKTLKWSHKVAMIAEVPLIACLPNAIVQHVYLKPMRLQTGGSVLAGKLALERGWAINIGGGFHHCSGGAGGGFCPYADITLLIRCLLDSQRIKTAMILDLDAHQGNGHERDFLNVPEVYIMDMYNSDVYPKDRSAKKAIRKRVQLKSGCHEVDYMNKLVPSLKAALKEFKPDIMVYNAGTDILEHDPLGAMNVSPTGVINRDHFVFAMCYKHHIPIVMLTSGGYMRESARLIASSIRNLYVQGLIGIVTNEPLPPLPSDRKVYKPWVTPERKKFDAVQGEINKTEMTVDE